MYLDMYIIVLDLNILLFANQHSYVVKMTLKPQNIQNITQRDERVYFSSALA